MLSLCEDNNNSNAAWGGNIKNRDYFLRYSTTINDDPEEDLLAGWWNHAEDVFRRSLQELRVLRARIERDRNADVDPNQNDNNMQERMQMIRDCLRLLDNLSDSLPRAEEYSSSWLAGDYDSNDDASGSSSSAGSFLDKDLLNQFLKEWMMEWKAQQCLPACNTTVLPSPSQMAERVDKYRSRCLVQPDPTSFNLLLNAMIGDNNSNNGRSFKDRIKAVRLADDYLGRLLKAQQRYTTLSSSSQYYYVDAVSVTTVMKGWVNLGQPQKAQEWLDAGIPLNAIAYSTLIHGWARRGEALSAESVLEMALEEATSHIADRTNMDMNMTDSETIIGDDYYDCHERNVLIVDRVVFHTVLDAWAARAASQWTSGNSGLKGTSSRSGITTTSNDGDENENRQPVVVPAVRAKALVQTMNDMSDHHPLSFGHLRPNDETWHKLIAVVATSQQLQAPHRRSSSSSSSKTNKRRRTVEEEVGPRAAEKLLLEFESRQQHDLLSSSPSSCPAPAVLLNRILNAYCSCGTQMEAAEAFYHRRCNLLEEESPRQQTTATTFPNEVTFNTMLTGWANAAKVAAKKKTKKNTAAAAAADEIPLRAQAWLEVMQEHHGGVCRQLSTRSFSSVLQAWSLSTHLYKDAADRAEDLLRRSVWKLLLSSSSRSDLELEKGIVICTNIVLRAWSNQIAAAAASGNNNINNTDHSNRAVGKCIRLLHDFLDLVEKEGQKTPQKMSSNIKPTEETFRAVLHAIATPSNGMNPVQKHEHAKDVLHCMKETFRLYPSKGDLSKFQRLTKRRDAVLERQRQKCSR